MLTAVTLSVIVTLFYDTVIYRYILVSFVFCKLEL